MRLLEHSVKNIFNEFGIKTPRGIAITKLGDLKDKSKNFSGLLVVKAQVPIGGRGKAGGIKIGANESEAADLTKDMLGTALKEYVIQEILLEEKIAISNEYYLSVITDSHKQAPVIIVSKKGGVDIEETAKNNPEDVQSLEIDPLYGINSYQTRFLLSSAGFENSIIPNCINLIRKLYKIYWEKDCQLIEINPLVSTIDGDLVAADAKAIIDDNALFRQKEINSWKQLSDIEEKVENARINYIPLNGDIGIIGTGAGMAMVNLDQVAHFGGKPANFMDVGPSINIHGAKTGLDILLNRNDLKAILISGYTGSRLDIFANDIIDALKEKPDTKIPIVVRLQGRNESSAKEILDRCDYNNIHFCSDFDQAAKMAVNLSKQKTDG